MEHVNQQSEVIHETCPAAALLQVLSKKHALLLMHTLQQAPQGFVTLERAMEVNTATLSKRLKELEQAELITRSKTAQRGRSVEYTLSVYGTAVASTLDNLGTIAKTFHEKR
jgi:DNA-binding HxlR family transcriptional regulator